MDLIDISRELSPDTAVWPGDRSFEWEWTTHVQRGDSVNVGSVCLSTHTGSHADAPLHVQSDGASTSAFTIEDFIGPAEIIDVTEAEAVRPAHVRGVRANRLLFKTSASALSDKEWPASVTPLDPEVVPLLEQKHVVLIGTDAPSIDPLDSSDLPVHHGLIDAGIMNLEGLDLADVSPGRYSLLALPLRLREADAAPVRAVLADASLFE